AGLQPGVNLPLIYSSDLNLPVAVSTVPPFLHEGMLRQSTFSTIATGQANQRLMELFVRLIF
ncbi:MAG: hypothetical protein ACYS8Y_05265, partial [Planctomycetota bacterium]